MKKYEITDETQLYLVGYRVDADRTDENWDFYTLYIDDERAIDFDGFPIIFFNVDHMEKALKASDCGCEHLPLPLADDIAEMDIAQVVSDLMGEDKTDNGDIVDCLNTLLDFLVFLPEARVHQEYKRRMRQAANHFTFRYEIKEYFENNNVSRIELVQAMEWAVGATLLWAKFVY